MRSGSTAMAWETALDDHPQITVPDIFSVRVQAASGETDTR